MLLVLPVLIFLYLFLVFPTLRKHKDREILKNYYYAHRGLHNDEIPENSMTAFMLAAANDFAIELDIHLTADGELVVFHDNTLDRMCGVSGRVEDKSLAELRQLFLKDTSEKIPTFKEVLTAIDGRVPIMVEFKCPLNDCEKLCLAADKLLSSYKGKYSIISFNPLIPAWYRKNRKNIMRGQLAMSSKGKGVIPHISNAFLLNFLVRPDFVSYEQKNSNNLSFKIQKLLGAFPVGWTFKSEIELKAKIKDYNSYIFENFKPTDV